MISSAVRMEVYEMSNEDIDNMYNLLEARRNVLNATVSTKFSIGQRVTFAGKRGRTVQGNIERLMRGGKFEIKNCTDGYVWRMPATMLRPA